MQRWDIDERGYDKDPTGEWVKFSDAQAAIAAAVAAERERCAKVREDRAKEEVGDVYAGIALDCANAIRAAITPPAPPQTHRGA